MFEFILGVPLFFEFFSLFKQTSRTEKNIVISLPLQIQHNTLLEII